MESQCNSYVKFDHILIVFTPVKISYIFLLLGLSNQCGRYNVQGRGRLLTNFEITVIDDQVEVKKKWMKLNQMRQLSSV